MVLGLINKIQWVFCLWLFPDEAGTRVSTYIYFGISLLVIVVSVAMCIWVLAPSPLFAYYIDKAERAAASIKNGRINGTSPLTNSESSGTAYVKLDEDEDSSNSRDGGYGLVWSAVWPMALAVAGVFWVTLALFPGITAAIESTNSRVGLTYGKIVTNIRDRVLGVFIIYLFCLVFHS